MARNFKNEIESKLNFLSRQGIEPGLDRMKALLKLMGNPEKKLKFIHIGGTNGKGSNSLMISSILSEAGYKVGRFTSPHLHSYTERISIDNEEIEERALISLLDKVEKNIPELLDNSLQPTEFEILTALALQYFYDHKVDLAVMEVGMGGLYDSTNIIEPVVSIITNVAMDHMNYLGDDLDSIAFNKAGIIKENCPLVIGSMDKRAEKVLIKKASEVDAKVYFAQDIIINNKKQDLDIGQILDIKGSGYNYSSIGFSLLGNYQLDNLATTLMAIKILQEKSYSIDDKHIIKVLADLKNPGRFEVLKRNPLIIIDLAHNIHAASSLSKSLSELVGERKKILVIAVLDDKDMRGIVEQIGENTAMLIVCKADSNRSEQWRDLGKVWQEVYPDTIIIYEENIEAACQIGLNNIQMEQYLLCTGSFYLLDRAREYIIKK